MKKERVKKENGAMDRLKEAFEKASSDPRASMEEVAQLSRIYARAVRRQVNKIVFGSEKKFKKIRDQLKGKLDS